MCDVMQILAFSVENSDLVNKKFKTLRGMVCAAVSN